MENRCFIIFALFIYLKITLIISEVQPIPLKLPNCVKGCISFTLISVVVRSTICLRDKLIINP